MQSWNKSNSNSNKPAAVYAPLAAIDDDDYEEAGRSSLDSGSSSTLTGTPDNERQHYPGQEEAAEEGSSKYPPDSKSGSTATLLPQQYHHGLYTVRRHSLIKYVLVLLLCSVILLIVLLVVALSGSLPSLTPTPSKVSDLSQEILSNDSTNTTVDEALLELRNEGWIPIDSSISSPFVPSRRPLVPLASQVQTSYACAEQWIAKGELCNAMTNKRPSLKDSEVDVAWTWVTANEHWSSWRDRLSRGSERLVRRLQRSEKRQPQVEIIRGGAGIGHSSSSVIKNSKDKHYRSHHQLRYSQRSILQNLPFVKTLHLLLNDLPACDPRDVLCSNTHENRIGQVPEWLDVKKVQDQKATRFNLQFHWDLFKADDEDAGAWRARTLPTFDSLAIESQLPNLRSTAENFFYMNDDLYIIRDLSPADLVTPLFGQVLRIQKDLGVGGEAPGTSKQKADGEWPGMTYSAWLLDRRFGIRSRSYLVHQAKMLSRPLLDEVASIWSEELKKTAQIRFRGTGGKTIEVNMMFLATYYTIEKHREALLWSYFVAKMDSSRRGRYSFKDRQDMLGMLGVSMQDGALQVSRPQRTSYDGEQAGYILKSAHLQPPRRTPYQFSSLNGYAFMPMLQPQSSWPDFDATTISEDHPWQICNITISTCFGSDDFFKADYEGDTINSQSLFKNMAFEHPECGDCAIAAILSQNKQGLGAFLPESRGKTASTPFDPTYLKTSPPLLGKWNKNYEQIDWSIQAVLGDTWNLREYTVRLLQRYAYVIGGTPSRFIGLKRPLDTVRALQELTKSLEDPDGPALIALNDDIVKEAYVRIVDTYLDNWHNKIWPNRTIYEIAQLEVVSGG